MNTLDILRKLHGEVSARVPSQYMGMVDVEFIKIADEVKMKEDVLSCTACPLHETCTHKVPGEGSTQADIMFISESPGENEDREGRPFVGPSGQLMDTILDAIGWKREDIYITNVLKCQTPDRKPHASELAACRQHLLKEIEIVKPKVILCWGSLPANLLIHPEFRITQEIGHWFEEGDRRLMAVYHPSYILRQADGSPKQDELKWQLWNALQKVKEYQESGFPNRPI
jgi:DNA polymerase